MGYESHWSGEIRITPPLSWGEIKAGPGLQDITLRLDERVEDTATGQTRHITSAAITPISGSAYNGYDINQEIQALIDAHPDHQYSGAIVARPLDPDGTPFRFIVSASPAGRQRVVGEQLRAVWPHGTEATP